MKLVDTTLANILDFYMEKLQKVVSKGMYQYMVQMELSD